jgi:hypothetical protein
MRIEIGTAGVQVIATHLRKHFFWMILGKTNEDLCLC